MSAKAEKLQTLFKGAEVIAPPRSSYKALILHCFFVLLAALLAIGLFIYSGHLVNGLLNDLAREKHEHFVRGQLEPLQSYMKALDSISYQQGQEGAMPASVIDLFDFVAVYETDPGAEQSQSQLVPLEPVKDRQGFASLQLLASDASNMNRFLSQTLETYQQEPSLHAVISARSLYENLNYLGTAGLDDFLFIKEFLINDGQKRAWLLASVPQQNIFTPDLSEERAQGLRPAFAQINEHVSKAPLYTLGSQQPEVIKSFLPLQTSVHAFAGNRWQVLTQFRTGASEKLLEKIPGLVGIAGAFFVLFAALQAVLQVRQEKRIGQINHVLEQKNKALEHAAGQREKLDYSLKKSEQENLTLLNSISDIIFETDASANLLRLNDAWKRITGFDVQQSLGKSLFNLLHSEDKARETESFENMLKGKKSAYRSIVRLRGLDGTYRSVELSFSMIRRTDDGGVKVVGSITDVEERYRAEQALGEAEQKYQAIVENAAWGIYQMTPEGIYLSVNTAMVNLLGYDSAQELLHNIDNAHTQVYVNGNVRKGFLREVAASGAVNGYETRIVNKAGEQIWVVENVRAIKDDDQNVLYYEGSLENISDRKEATIMLRDAKLHSDMANRAKTEFLTNMSHELRTPLNAIIGFSEIMKMESLGAVGNDTYKEYIEEIHKGGKRLLTIINEILDISRIEVRERELNESTVHIEEIMATSISLLESQAHGNQIAVKNMLDSVPLVIAEERALKQIFTNILSNAIKFTPRGGHVIVRNEISPNGNLNISFADNGVGLDVEEIKKALSPFGQVGSSLDQSSAGTGLGLTLVKALIELHGGKLDIFSQKGVGTTVTVKLPMARIVQQAASQKKSGKTLTSKESKKS